MPTRNRKLYSFILVLVDTLVLIAAFVLAYVLRVHYDPRPLVGEVYAFQYLLTFLAFVPFWILIFAALGLYGADTYNRRLTEWGKVGLGVFIGILLIIGWEYVSQELLFPARLVAVYALIGSFLLVIFERETMRFIRSLLFKFGRGTSRVLLIGNSTATLDIARSLADTRRSGYDVVAIAGPRLTMDGTLDVRHFATAESALKHLDELRVTTIIQTDLYDSAQRNQLILGAAQTNHIDYNFIPGEAEFYTGKNTVDVFLGYPMISVSQTPLIGWGSIAKRIFDITVSGLLIIILSPFLLLITLIQKLSNPGPVFYVSKRLSRFSEPINLIKFRSMRPEYGRQDAAIELMSMGRQDLADEYEAHRKVSNDPRITRFGHLLRNLSLDELPQLFNVFRGDLSLVGPRPILPQEAGRTLGKKSLLHSVKSGMTGLWQVSGRSELSFEDRIELESFYAQNWSFLLDIKILFRTIGVVLRRRGAK